MSQSVSQKSNVKSLKKTKSDQMNIYNKNGRMVTHPNMKSDIKKRKKVLMKNWDKMVFNEKIDTVKPALKTYGGKKKQNISDNKKVHNICEEVRTEANDQNATLNQKISLLKSSTAQSSHQEGPVPSNSVLNLKDEEYYPDKIKRKIDVKKIVLQPKHEYKIVGTTNKRKRNIPLKEVDYVSPLPFPPTEDTELTLYELVCLTDEHGLDDEDFMEILTCPSPVWWEEHDDHQDEIRFRFQKNNAGDASELQNTLLLEIDQKATKCSDISKTEDKQKCENSAIDFFKRVAAKRSKLENLLYNIKTKNITPDVSQCNFSETKEIENIDENVKCNETSVTNTVKSSNKIEKTPSTSSASGISINEELINSLETIEIPVKGASQNGNEFVHIDKVNINEEEIMKKLATKSNMSAENEIKIVKINEIVENTKSSEVETRTKRTRKPNRKYDDNEWSPEIKRRRRQKRESTDDLKSKKGNENKRNVSEIPAKLPTLTKNPFKNELPKSYASPKSIKRESMNVAAEDSISDTNITFLDEYVEKQEAQDAVNVKKYCKDKNGELVTVYQIVNNTNSNDDIESQIKVNLVNKSPQFENVTSHAPTNLGQINEFYKTKKNVHNGRKKNIKNED